MATSATAIAAATSSSLSFHNKLPHLPSESSSSSYSFISIPNTHFTPQSKPTNPIKLKASSSTLLLRLRLPISSSAFDNVDVVTEDEQSTEQSESETETDPEDEIDGDDDQSETESPGAGRLYVGNLPYAMTSTQLREVFGEAGSVLSVEIVYDRVTDRSRGFAFVTMASVEDAKVAIQMFDGSVASNGSKKGGKEAEKFRHGPFSNSAESQNSEVLQSDSANLNSSNEENGNYRSNALGSEVTSMFSRGNLDPFSFHHLQQPVHSFSGMMSTGHVMPGQWVAAAAASCCNLKV